MLSAKVFPLKQFVHSCWRCLGLALGLTLVMSIWICPASLALIVNEIPNPRQENYTWISDRAELLSPSVESELNRRISQFAVRTTAEIAIATVPQLAANQASHTFALELFNHWGIGQRDQNNGVLVFVARDNRQIEVITGKGLTEKLPDREVDSLIQQQILPAFRQKEYETGIVKGTTAIADRLEAQLPSALFPSIVPQVLGILGAGFAVIGYVAIAIFVRTPIILTVPTQGRNDTEFQFHAGAEWLSRYTLPGLLARLFNPAAERWQTPWLGQICLWLGGILVGTALALGWHSLVLSNPAWGNWYLAILGCLVYLIAGLLGTILSAFLKGLASRENWFMLFYPLMFAIGSSWHLAHEIYSWHWVLGFTLVENLASIACWVIFCDGSTFRRQWSYISQSSKQSPQELTPDEIESVLDTAENLAVSMGNLHFRGWREPTLQPPLTKEQVYLVQASTREAQACEQCRAFTVEKSVRQAKKTIQTQKKVKGQKQKQLVDTVVEVEQTVYTCCSCGHTEVVEPAFAPFSFDQYVTMQQTESPSPTSLDSSSISSSDYDYNQTYDSSGSDFGGGSSDGGGAGSDW